MTASNFSSSITDLVIRNAELYFNKQTKLVILQVDIYSALNLIPVMNNVIFTIPQKYRPRNTVENYAILYDQNTTTKWEACNINPSNGNCRLGNWLFGDHPVRGFALEIEYYAN